MRDYKLGFISNESIYNHVRDTVRLYRNHIDLKRFNQNLVDPVKLTFDAKVYGKTFEEIIEAECIRQIDKTNTNHIGYFHQNLFKYVGNGWEVPPKGFDVANNHLHIYVELKNKHNTMNGGAGDSVYMKMQDKILHDDQATCLLVEVIATKSQVADLHEGRIENSVYEELHAISPDTLKSLYLLSFKTYDGFQDF